MEVFKIIHSLSFDHFQIEKPVNDAHNSKAVRVLPSAAVQAIDHDKMLPDKAADNSVIAIIKQKLSNVSNVECHTTNDMKSSNLKRKDQLTVLFWGVVKLDEVIPHPDKAVMIEPCGISLGLRLAQGKTHEVVNGCSANLTISVLNSGSYIIVVILDLYGESVSCPLHVKHLLGAAPSADDVRVHEVQCGQVSVHLKPFVELKLI